MAKVPLSGLGMIHTYDSDSDVDSGYKSDEERKRKNSYNLPQIKKKQKKHDQEDMIVDYDSDFNSLNNMSFQKIVSDRNSTSNCFVKKSTGRTDMLPSSLQNSNILIRSVPFPDELLITSQPENSTLHQGRIRSFPHERGNWASYLYIQLTFGTLKPHLNSMISALTVSCKNSGIELISCEDFHISLSPTFVVRVDWIDPIVDALRKKLSSIDRFAACLLGLDVFCNDERTRTFLALKVGFGKDKMKAISVLAEELLHKYELNISYKDFTYHVSIAWCLGDYEKELHDQLPLLGNICRTYFNTENDLSVIDVQSVYFKAGNRIHRISLKLRS